MIPKENATLFKMLPRKLQETVSQDRLMHKTIHIRTEAGKVENDRSRKINAKPYGGPREELEHSAAISQADVLGERYMYQPFPPSTSFRVLKLLHEREGKETPFHLQTTDFDNLWNKRPSGTAGATQTLGSTPEATTNSYKSTQTFGTLWCGCGFRTIPVPSWADAVCINRGDYDERNKQVQNTLQIYQHSLRVLIRLGWWEDNKAELAAATIHELVMMACNERRISLLALQNRRQPVRYRYGSSEGVRRVEVGTTSLSRSFALAIVLTLVHQSLGIPGGQRSP